MELPTDKAFAEARYVDAPRGDGFLGALDQGLDRLENELQRLAVLLDPVLLPSSPPSDMAEPGAATGARGRVMRVMRLYEHLSDINGRLDL